jgi:hypothetical protein
VFTLPDAMPAPTSGVAYPRLKKNSSAAPTSGVFDVVVDTNVSNAAKIGEVQGVSNCDQYIIYTLIIWKVQVHSFELICRVSASYY